MPKPLATKPLSVLNAEACEEGERTLRRSLGPVNLITLGISERPIKSEPQKCAAGAPARAASTIE